jgi:hypothetical protein
MIIEKVANIYIGLCKETMRYASGKTREEVIGKLQASK